MAETKPSTSPESTTVVTSFSEASLKMFSNQTMRLDTARPDPDVNTTPTSTTRSDLDMNTTPTSTTRPDPDMNTTPTSTTMPDPDVNTTPTSTTVPDPDMNTTPTSTTMPDPDVNTTPTSSIQKVSYKGSPAMTDVTKTSKPLSVVTKLCYGIGGIGPDLIWLVFGAYTSTFLVQVAQLPPLFATSVIFGSRAIDIFCNFAFSPLIDRTNTRWGKAKPWIVASLLIITVTNALIWYVPDVGTDGKLVWYVLLYVLMKLAMSGFHIPYRTYVMFLTDDGSDRDSAVLYRTGLALGGLVGGSGIHGQILALYRRSEYDACDMINTTYMYGANNTNSSMDGASLAMTKNGYLISSAALCLVTLVGWLTVSFGTTERKDISTTSGGEGSAISLLRTLKTVLTFRPNVYLLLAYCCIQASVSIVHGAIALYVEYSLDLEDQIENVILAFMVSSALAMPVVALVVSKIGKKTSYLCFQLVAIPLFIGFQFVPSGSLAVYAIVIGHGFSSGAHFFIPWALMSDIIEDCYLQTKERLDTAFFAVLFSINSVGITIGLLTATIGLE
ncbi:MFSD2A [Branchiostoma lanceolatum]|uniref:MFSD2A protein n=1 Tax=Branchiostoma lanceolatum TaxID=7740 RepID=A0A8K0EU37_BRALA|nr:MFSD2A [Branchiostoma lanceolatum]